MSDETDGSAMPPDGWTVWNDEPGGRRILAYRPDVFNESEFPAEQMPTIFVWNGSRANRPGASRIRTGTWRAILRLEPDVEAAVEEFDSRAAAVEGANDLARRFADSEVAYRDAYQVAPEAYLAKLDELTAADE